MSLDTLQKKIEKEVEDLFLRQRKVQGLKRGAHIYQK